MKTELVSVEKTEEMFEAYTVEQSIAYVSKTVGISYPTCKKYIERGDPKRGIEPLATRFRRLVRQVAKRTERRVAFSKVEQMAEAAAQLQGLDDLIFEAVNALKGKLDPSKLRLTDVAKAIQIRNQVASMYFETTETTTVEELVGTAFDGWTPEEISRYAETGSRFGNPAPRSPRSLPASPEPEPDDTDGEQLDDDDPETDDDEQADGETTPETDYTNSVKSETECEGEGFTESERGKGYRSRARRPPSPPALGSVPSPRSGPPSPRRRPPSPPAEHPAPEEQLPGSREEQLGGLALADPALLDALDVETDGA